MATPPLKRMLAPARIVSLISDIASDRHREEHVEPRRPNPMKADAIVAFAQYAVSNQIATAVERCSPTIEGTR